MRPGERFPRPLRLVFAVILLLVAAVVFFKGHSNRGAGEIFLNAAGQPGSDTFAPSIAAPLPTTIAPNALSASIAPNAGRAGSNGLQQINANLPGLYGGVRNKPSCNARALIDSLRADPPRSAVWASVLGINASDVGAFIVTLTPTVLRVDTRVTEFGFADGRAVPRQAVLQSGDAVLLDRSDFPRVRCASGDPLSPPQAVPSAPRYNGPRWPRFDPTTIIVITPAASANPAIVVIDIGTGAPFARIPGSITIIDIDRPAAGVALLVVVPGQTVLLTGAGWAPGAVVTIRFDDPAVDLGTATADGDGNVRAQVRIPAEALPGVHRATISDGNTTVPQTLYVIPPPVTA